MITDIQDLIYALHFESGSTSGQHASTFSFSFLKMIEHFHLNLLPWQEIKVEDGPKSLSISMYQVLKAAIDAIKAVDQSVLNVEKDRHDIDS